LIAVSVDDDEDEKDSTTDEEDDLYVSGWSEKPGHRDSGI